MIWSHVWTGRFSQPGDPPAAVLRPILRVLPRPAGPAADPDRGAHDPLEAAALDVSLRARRWWHGWYSELELDPAAREITIHRRPRFFTGPRTKTYAASDLRLGEGVENHYIGSGQRSKFARFELRDTSGKRVFSYMTLYDARSRAKLDADMQRLQDFFGRA